MRMLWWMIGITRKDKIKNQYVRQKLGVAPINDKLKESRLKWYGTCVA